ncbi:pyridoxal-phosphate dependent enzyme [Nonomuraea sp. NPDC050786]|uniref:pyridoxal-phosphate dependent enzyme n=1 Tax=Nonomuraea sp. NPDC050786 TaxID=3154840 RepID=UPI0034013160
MSLLDGMSATEARMHQSAEINPLAAARELRGAVVRTPIRRLPWLERVVGVPVWVKLECQQHSGSFKYRGAHLAMSRVPSLPVVAASAGNHGLAVAEVAARMGRKANICVPAVASRLKRERILATGAGLIEYGNSLEEASRYAQKIANENSAHYISPYNDGNVISGTSTIALEFLEDVPSLRSIIAPIGGGGLISGLGLGAAALGHELELIGCEPERYASLRSSIASDRIVRVVHQSTLADGLAVNLEPDSITFPIVRQMVSDIVALTEEELAAGTYALLVHESMLVEPAGAAGVIACLKLAARGQLTGPVGIPLCGGNLHHATLSKIQRFPYKDPDLIRLLDLRGRAVADMPVLLAKPMARSTAYTPSSSDPRIDIIEQLGICSIDLAASGDAIREFAAYCGHQGLSVEQAVVDQLLNTVAVAANRVDEQRTALSEGLDEDPTDRLAAAESVLRFGLATHSYARGTLEWCSPSYAQSQVVQFFDTGAQDSPTVNYERYESASTLRVERQLLEVLELQPDLQAVSVVSSGMAAYSLIESFLLRSRLASGDTVLLAPYLYFEASEQLTALPFVRFERARDYTVEALMADILQLRPRCVFIDPIANTAQQRMVDVKRLLHELRQHVDWSVTVVVDGTMVSGALPSEELLSSGSVEVIYYESCSKYLQLGLDAGMAGLVVYPIGLRPQFERLRRNSGSILYRHYADLFPRFDRALFHRRMQRISDNALRVAEHLLASDDVRQLGRVHYPGLSVHPDVETARQLRYAGGCVTFEFQDVGRNYRDQLEPVVEHMLTVARESGLHLTKGVSFGFSAPRISAAASMAETEPPFLRLYAGDRGVAQVELLAEAARRAIVGQGLVG